MFDFRSDCVIEIYTTFLKCQFHNLVNKKGDSIRKGKLLDQSLKIDVIINYLLLTYNYLLINYKDPKIYFIH